MANPNWIVCSGVSNYSSYKLSIGFDTKGIVAVPLPHDTVCHSDCCKFFEKTKMQRSDVYKVCLSLKCYLAS